MNFPRRCHSTYKVAGESRPVECMRRDGHPADGSNIFAFHSSQDNKHVRDDDDDGVSIRPESPFPDQGVLAHRDIDYERSEEA